MWAFKGLVLLICFICSVREGNASSTESGQRSDECREDGQCVEDVPVSAPEREMRGCFAPWTLVTMADGSRQSIGQIAEGDVVLSWDEDREQASTAQVVGVTRVQRNDLIDVLLEDGVTRITSTPDHPFWSHAKQQIVSKAPQATQDQYGLPALLMDVNETFADEFGRPLKGSIEHTVIRRSGTESSRRRVTSFLAEQNTEVVTLCLDRFHWFFVHGVRVHNKGCFAAETLVTLGDGSRKEISSISSGDVMLSWDDSTQTAANATVKSVMQYWSSDLMSVRLENGSTRIVSTPDHPYWSEAKRRIVSRNPEATTRDYALATELMDLSEIFVDERRQPVLGDVVHHQATSVFGEALPIKVFTVCLDRHHWFFVHGIRVHNKGCFTSETLITLGDGSRKEISSVSSGDVMLSWDEKTQTAANATVMSVMEYSSSDLISLVVEGGNTRIVSTPDHPYWSEAKQRIVSRDPQATTRDYGLVTEFMDDNETFMNELGQPIQGTTVVQQKPFSHTIAKVFTVCLDKHHWFFVHGIRVHNKGCFIPSTLVTMGDGTRKPIGTVAEGDLVLSWDEERKTVANASVAKMMRYQSRSLMNVLLEDGVTRISSTPDHPYWSESKQRIVSKDPHATAQDYGLVTGMMDGEELFVDEVGRPIKGLSHFSSTNASSMIHGSTFLSSSMHDVVTFCLDRFHWFYVHGIRVHNKGCFVPSTMVTLGDGATKAIGNIKRGDVVLSWDALKQMPRRAKVAEVLRYRSDRLMDVVLEDGLTRITSTPDHPYWSETKKRLVSLDPKATEADYGLPTLMADVEEHFVDASGQVRRGSALLRDNEMVGWFETFRELLQGDPHCIMGRDCEVVTLSLENSHWFYANGVRVHNKGTGDSADYCCCKVGFTWNLQSKTCEPCSGDGLQNQGLECFEQCGQRSGQCPFCGTKGKCCREKYNGTNDLRGELGCALYEGDYLKHVCVGSAPIGLLQHDGADCFEQCGNRAGKCDWCGKQGFCCRRGPNAPNDLTGDQGCFPEEGGHHKHMCISRTPSCDVPDIIQESYDWWACQTGTEGCGELDLSTYCCCDAGWLWDNASASCQLCPGGTMAGSAQCPGSTIIEWTQVDAKCHPSQHLHSCVGPMGFWGYFWLFFLAGCCLFICCAGPAAEKAKEAHFNSKAQACKRAQHELVETTCSEEGQRDSTYMQGWYCDNCNRYTSWSDRPFQRCTECGVDFCDACAEQSPSRGGLIRQVTSGLSNESQGTEMSPLNR